MHKIELIDRAAVIDTLRNCLDTKWFGSIEASMHYRESIEFAMSCINAAPTIDAAPVRRSEWVTDDDNNDDWAEPYCKKCGCFIPLGPAHFCPHCGAQMSRPENGEIAGGDEL